VKDIMPAIEVRMDSGDVVPEGLDSLMNRSLKESYTTISSQRELSYTTICCVMIFLLA
jgi:hypothetical protein